MPITIEDLALGRITSASRLYCLHCGDEFKRVKVGNEYVRGCITCWRKNRFAGKPPSEFAPVGAFAGQGLWEAVDVGGMQRQNSKDSIYIVEPGRNSSKDVARSNSRELLRTTSKELKRHGSKQSKRRGGSKEGASDHEGLPRTPDHRSGSKEGRHHSPEKEHPGRRHQRVATLQLSLPLWRMEEQLADECSPASSPMHNAKEDAGNSRVFLPPPSPNGANGGAKEHSTQPWRAESKEESRMLLPAAVSSSMPDLRATSSKNHGGSTKLGALVVPGSAQGKRQLMPPQSQQSQRRRPHRPNTIGNELMSPPRSANRLAPLGIDEDLLPPLGGQNSPGNSPSHAASMALMNTMDDRRQVVSRKLCQKRAHSDTMTAIASSVDHEKLSSGEAFRMMDGSGGYFISKLELQKGLRRLGVSVSALELDAVLRSFDTDGTGTIDIEEFTDIVKSWFVVFPSLKPKAVQDSEAERLARDTGELICGFATGARVKSVVKIPNLSELREEGVVLGPGVTNGSVAVRFETSGQMLSVKPGMIAASKRQQSLPAFDSNKALA